MVFSRSPRRVPLSGWPGRPPGNSHGTVAGTADGGVAAAGGGEVAHKPGQGFGQGDRGGAEDDRHAGAVVADVAGGKAGGALRVEQQEQPRDPVGQGHGAVVQEPSCFIPEFLGVMRAAGASQPGQPAEFLVVPEGLRGATPVRSASSPIVYILTSRVLEVVQFIS
jgi:hypothetical protein